MVISFEKERPCKADPKENSSGDMEIRDFLRKPQKMIKLSEDILLTLYQI